MDEKNTAEEDQPLLKKSPLWTARGFLGCFLAVGSVAGCCFLLQRYREEKANQQIRSHNRVFARGIAAAVREYYGDYNRLPKPTSANPGEDRTTDSSGASGIIQILLGKESDTDITQNSRKINYLEGIRAARARPGVRTGDAEGSEKWAGGLVIEEGNMELVDSQGSYFRIRLDSNYDGEMENPNTDEVSDGWIKLPDRVIVWGPGKDGKWETWDDNPKSWD